MTRLFAGTPFDRPPTCDRCGQLEVDCACPPLVAESPKIPPDKQTATLRVEKRAKGKVVTVVRGLLSQANDLPALLAQLKNRCGAGGTLTGDELEIQGDHVDKIRTVLEAIGYRVRK